MQKIVKWSGCFIAILVMIFMCHIVLSLYFLGCISDGREYRKSNWVDYYYLTPDVIKNAPEISSDAIYYVQGGDENTFLEEKVTWTQVKDVPQAVKVLKTYLVESGIDVEARYNIGERYFIIPYEDKVSLLINTCMKNC